MTLRHGYAHIGDANLHYTAAGDPDAPMLLFLHGFPEYGGMWHPLMQRLADRFYCVAPDQLGYNLSDKPADVARYRTTRLVDDVLNFARAIAPKRKFTLVAHDWGGAVAWAYALRYAGTLDRLVIVNAVHPAIFRREIAANPNQAQASQYMVDMQAADADARFAADDFARLRHSFRQLDAKGLMPPDELAHYRQAWSQPGAITGMLNWYRAMGARPRAANEAPAKPAAAIDESKFVVTVPTLVLWGLKDEALLPGCIEGLDRCVPDLTLKTYADGTHWLIHEEPAAIAAEIATFVGAAA